MNRHFKEFVNARFLEISQDALPGSRRLVSAAMGGGCTMRLIPRKGFALYLGVETLAQRERVRLFCGWSRLGRTPAFDDVHETAARRLVGSTPEAVFHLLDEGCLDAVNLGEPINVLDVEPDWVPWPVIRDRLRKDAHFLVAAEAVMGDDMVRAILEPGALERPPRAFSLTWEQWFMMIDHGLPYGPSVDELLRPLCDAMQHQVVQVFRPFLAACATA